MAPQPGVGSGAAEHLNWLWTKKTGGTPSAGEVQEGCAMRLPSQRAGTEHVDAMRTQPRVIA